MPRSSSRTGKTPLGQRQLRVAERIRHILSDVMRDEHFADPALSHAHLVTVTSVDIGPDLKHAHAYVMPLGGKDADVVIAALNRASGTFRTALSRNMDLRQVPKISFKHDHSFDNASHINTLLSQERVRRDVEKPADDHSDDGDDGQA